ncbi:Crp/Fnr family transcriptional regulator [Marinobacter sp. OP 3.4]|uniref:Crp/Fnr family transcriptional regulator n=1 Tax=Marinobacter sp. OP 3.4 TaxID=3076501 RepID=UPI002E1D00BD
MEQLIRHGRSRHYRQGEYLFHQGDQADRLCFLKAGLVKAHYDTLDGKEFIKSFVKEGGFIGSISSLTAGNPAPFSVVCLEDSETMEVDAPTLMALMDRDHGIATSLNTMLLGLAARKELREYELLCLTPETRYQRFLDRYGDLVERLTQANIARYLGITPVALSRIRKRL